MLKLYVLYDTRCGLCRRLKDWLLAQRCWLELEMVPAGSRPARQMFPELEQIASSDDLVVISDEGHVYLNDRAWIMCLYALEDYRSWACRLAHPLLLPLARQAFDTLSKNRHAIARWMGGNDPGKIANELRRVELAPCQAEERQAEERQTEERQTEERQTEERQTEESQTEETVSDYLR